MNRTAAALLTLGIAIVAAGVYVIAGLGPTLILLGVLVVALGGLNLTLPAPREERRP